MRAITPNYVNDLADLIATTLGWEFPNTQFIIEPEVMVSSVYSSTHEDDGITFSIMALMLPTGSCHRRIFLRLGGDMDVRLADHLTGLVKDLKTLLPNPSPAEVSDAQT